MDYKKVNEQEQSRTKLMDIAYTVFPKMTNKIEVAKQEPYNLVIYGIMGMINGNPKATIDLSKRAIAYYDKKHKRRIESLLVKYNEITPSEDWGSIPPKSKLMKRAHELGL